MEAWENQWKYEYDSDIQHEFLYNAIIQELTRHEEVEEEEEEDYELCCHL